MGLIQRLGIVIKSYFASASEAIDRAAAQDELTDAALRKKALEEVQSLQADTPNALESAQGSARPRISAEAQRLAADYRLLGVPIGASLPAVEDTWRKLAARADPKRFPAGSEEEKRAAEILTSINEAYERIREALNPTEGRFGQLEL
jgi:hypothetical protein